MLNFFQHIFIDIKKDPETSSGRTKSCTQFFIGHVLSAYNNTTVRPQQPDDHCLT